MVGIIVIINQFNIASYLVFPYISPLSTLTVVHVPHLYSPCLVPAGCILSIKKNQRI